MYDIAIVGARCTGAAAAMLLARKGYRVVMIDRDPPGSDMAHSTHFVQPVAVSKLRKWGLLAGLEAACPAFDSYSADFGVVAFNGKPPAVDGDARGFCPRRQLLDGLLVTGALAAGAGYLPNTRVVDVTRLGERVNGVRIVTAEGRTQDIAAELVIGADGPGSTVAAKVDAAHYHEAPAQQVTLWGYWADLPVDGLAMTFDTGQAIYMGPSSGGDTLVGVNWEMSRYKALNGDVEQDYYATIARLQPALAAQLGKSRLSTELRKGSTRNFLRVPHGPGWVLLGDAGHKKDPCTAQGITDAFNDVDECVEVIDAGLRGGEDLAAGLARWHAKRDDRLVPFHEMTLQMARFPAPDANEVALYRAIAASPTATTEFFGLISASTDPRVFFAPENIGKLFAS